MNTLPLFPDDSQNTSGSTETTPYSVGSLTNYIKRKFDEDYNLQSVWVEGEISNLSRPASGHLYFTLKDGDAQLRCVMWRSTVEKLGFEVEDHEQAVAHGKVSVYDRGGQYQLYVERLQPVGVGDLNRRLQLLYAQLKAEGLFDDTRKQPIPTLPLKIGIVTSSSAAAFQDVLNVLRRRLPLAEVILSPTSVQGDQAPTQIVTAIERLNRYGKVDVILLVRGGGSLEDLWCFNDERVVRAVTNSTIPIVSGVGHETDYMLVDYAADQRAPTPSAAAELVAPDVQGLQQSIESLGDRAYNAMATKFSDMRSQLDVQRRALRHLSPKDDIDNARQRVDDLSGRLERGIKHRLFAIEQQLAQRQTMLRSHDPIGMLNRGYAIVTRSGDGKRISSVQDAAPGVGLIVRLQDGTLHAAVKGRMATNAKPTTPATPADSGAAADASTAAV